MGFQFVIDNTEPLIQPHKKPESGVEVWRLKPDHGAKPVSQETLQQYQQPVLVARHAASDRNQENGAVSLVGNRH